MNKWYVIKVTPGKERQLCEYFNNKISNGELSFILRFVCPSEKELVIVKGKKIYREKVIYGGYLYFESEDSLTDDHLKIISANQHVMTMLGDKKPKRMTNTDVEKIIKDDVLDARIRERTLQYIQGEQVKIDGGPFSGFYATIESIKGNKVVLTLKVFGDNTTVETDLTQISKA